MWLEIAEQITQATNRSFVILQALPVGGGCVNQTYLLQAEFSAYFLKLNQPHRSGMFAAEALALEQIAALSTVRVPQPVCWGVTDQNSYLVLEALSLAGGNCQDWPELGRQLAQMHQQSVQPAYGWHQDNWIGSTPQINTFSSCWSEFFTHQRLGYQFDLAERRGGIFPRRGLLLSMVCKLLSNHSPDPVLVHGDLWSGNVGFTSSGQPVIFDPAAYFGDREVDLAMTHLFGGFPAGFYQGYDQVFPPMAGYRQRQSIYNLYHILNHFNLFGGSYQHQANQMIEQILSG
jgi:fructosamine-3-kinase